MRVGKDETLLLGLGAYEDVKVDKRAVLILTSGDYALEKLKVQDDPVIRLDLSEGPIVIDVHDELRLRERERMEVLDGTGSAEDALFRIDHADVELGEDGVYVGTFMAPYHR